LSLIEPRMQYTQRSFEDLRQQLIEVVQTTPGISDKWTDFNSSDLGLVLLELWCSIGDELNFYLDNQANESFIATARQRKSVVNLCKLIAYNLDPVVSSTGIVVFRLPTETPHPYSITIPKYTRIAASGSEFVPFITTNTVTLPAGSLAVESNVLQGILYEEEFISDNTPDQRFILGRKDIASNYNSIEVYVGVGTDISTYKLWSQAQNFIIETQDDNQNRFVIETDSQDQTILKFGNGKFGAIPPVGFTILVRYVSSIGANGNVGAEKISIVSDVLYDSTSQPVNLIVTNEEACVGGTDRETIEHAKLQAPQELSALNRAVTRFDATALVGGLAGIAIANVWGEHELPHPDIKHFNQMYVTMSAEGITPVSGKPTSWLPTTSLKNLVLDYIEDKKVITTRTVFVDPNVIFIDLQLDVFVPKSASPLTVKQSVLDVLNEFFDPASAVFGKDLRYSNLISALNALPSVDYVSLKLRRRGVTPGKGPFAGGNTVTILGSNFQTGATITFGNSIPVVATILDYASLECIVPPAENVIVNGLPLPREGFVDVTVTNPDLTTYTIPKAYYYHGQLNACEREDLGEEQTVDDSQFIYNDQDIIVRPHEFYQLGIIESADGTDEIMHFGQDSMPMTSKIVYSPLYTYLNQTVAFDGSSSSSPYSEITMYQWDMGSYGTLMVKNNSGSYVPAGTQPVDGRTVTTDLLNLDSTVYWQYTTRPQSGVATVVLTVFDSLGNCRATAIPYEIRLTV